ncbi:MAG: putative rane protein [Microbacterium sp.]|nr:putative rane protein [Microbacterium sp.]
MTTAEKHTTRTHRHAPRRREHRHTHTVWFFLGGLAVWLYLGIVVLHLLRNFAVAPTWIFIGAALVPATIFWIMLHRLRTTDTVTAVNLIAAAVIGGTLAIALGGTFDTLVGYIPQPKVGDLPVLTLVLAGFVEEFCKGLLIVVMGWRIVKSTRNGLFVGGAVGLGFAVLETMSYISTRFTGADPIFSAAGEAVERGILAPFGHVLWSALFGAALFSAAAKKGRFRLSWIVIGTYIAVAILHGAWDGSLVSVVALTGNALLGFGVQILGWGLSIIGGALIWRHIARKEPAPPVVDDAPGGEPPVTAAPAAPVPA